MRHSTTVLPRIVALYAQERALLDREYLTQAERDRFTEIRRTLEQLWPIRRAELTFQLHGPPRTIKTGADPREQRSDRHIAYGIAPLPGGR